MLTYEQQTKKLLSKRQAVLDRIESDKAEIEKINAKLNAIQLAKIREHLAVMSRDFLSLLQSTLNSLRSSDRIALPRAIQIQLRTMMSLVSRCALLTRRILMRIEK